jgi:hypothetical protein
VVIKSGASATTATVETGGNVRTVAGSSARPTFTASMGPVATTAIYSMQIESSAGTGFKLTNVCVAYALGATAAGTIVTTTINRRTTASSGGTLITNENNATPSVAKHDHASTNYTGAVRLTPTLGTAGALLDTWSFPQTVVAATTGITQPVVICKEYGNDGEQPIIVQAGTANGVSIAVSAGGAGSLAVGAIVATFIQE